MKTFIRIIIAGTVIAAAMPAGSIRATGEAEQFHHRDTSNQPSVQFQAGHAFALRGSGTGVWVDQANRTLKFDKAIEVDGSSQLHLGRAAVSFDNRVAVSATAVDRAGRIAKIVVMLTMSGETIRVVRTSPFGGRDIGFTSDGSLWVLGLETESGSEKSVHDILRQYNRDGTLVRTLLPRLDVSTGERHPAYGALLATSEHQVAVVSNTARKWVLVSDQGLTLGSGALDIPDRLVLIRAAVTDSGRIFVQGHWRKPTGTEPHHLFEINKSTGALDPLQTELAFSRTSYGSLAGSEGEKLVLYVHDKSQASARLVWASAD